MLDGTVALAAGSLLLCSLVACDKPAPDRKPAQAPTLAPTSGTQPAAVPSPADAAPESGTWYRGQLDYPKLGKLGFFLHVPPVGTNGGAYVRNHDEKTDFDAQWQGNRLTVTAPWTYTSVIAAERGPDGVLKGTWTRDTPLWGKVVRPFVGEPIDGPDPKLRYPSTGAPAADVSGSWKFQFAEHKEGKGVFAQTPDGVVTGSIRPGQLGDVRVLGGKLSGNELVLSHFNGNSANLIVASVSADGLSMSGTMSMQDVWIEKFTAKKVADFDHVKKVHLKKGHTRVTLKGLDKYKGKPTLAMIFATWCPSCNDATPYLKKLYATYHPQGFEILAVSYDLSEDEKQTRAAVEKYRTMHQVPWELDSVLCTTDNWAAAMPPELEGWDGLPILMLIRADGTVQTTYGGWFGPTTGADGERLRAWFEEEVKTLIAKP